MTAFVAPLVLAVMLLAVAVGGPRVLRAAAPALMRAPRTAVAVLLSAAGLWLTAVAALCLMMARALTGPNESIIGVCKSCLTGGAAVAWVDPVAVARVFLLVPVIALVVLLCVGMFRGLRRRRASAVTAHLVAAQARRMIIHGHRVLLTTDEHPTAYSLPPRHGGIVMSDALLSALRPEELAAVLAHEYEHVQGRHHFVLAVLDVALTPLRRVPLMAAIIAAVPHYLEIAADDAARRRTGTPALASALLKLGAPRVDAPARSAVATVLHAAGPDRIGHLVAPARVRSAIVPVVALGATAIAFAVATVAMHAPYVSFLAGGCPVTG